METQPSGFDPIAEAKRLLRGSRPATLGTLTPEGWPFATLTIVATDPAGNPILLLSRLAAHTQHLETDGRCSLLLAQTGKGDPLAHPRLTLTGRATPCPEERLPEVKRRFLARNPKAELYADFPDFAFWLVDIAAAHLNGGFGKAASLGGVDLLTPLEGCEALLAAEAGAVDHMNADHRDAIALCATRLLGLPPGDWRMTGLDPDGADLALGGDIARLPFPAQVKTGAALRATLVELASAARAHSP